MASAKLRRGHLYESAPGGNQSAGQRPPAFAGPPGAASPSAGAERFEELVRRGPMRIERIVSSGQASPPGFWYDQTEDEWVHLVSGAARLELEGGRVVDLGPGDWVELAAHLRHRVAWTHPSEPTVWLAVFYPPAEVV